VAEAKDGTSLVLAVTDGDTADRKAGHFNAVPLAVLALDFLNARPRNSAAPASPGAGDDESAEEPESGFSWRPAGQSRRIFYLLVLGTLGFWIDSRKPSGPNLLRSS
jgi:hypothetical protein